MTIPEGTTITIALDAEAGEWTTVIDGVEYVADDDDVGWAVANGGTFEVRPKDPQP